MFTQTNLYEVYKAIIGELSKIYPSHEAGSIALLMFEELEYSKLNIITDRKRKLTSAELSTLEGVLQRLLEHEPIQYILGKTEFFGFEFMVSPSVLIPRSETEELVDIIIKDIQISHPRILDIGTGSGCIAISLMKAIDNARIDALDNSEEALKVAMNNAKMLSANVHFHHLDILHEAILPGHYDVIVSNPPYVTEGEKSDMNENVLNYEPQEALFVSNNSPLVYYECIVELAARHLQNNGKLYFEINQNLANEVKTLLTEAGYTGIKILKDLSGNDRFTTASWTPKI